MIILTWILTTNSSYFTDLKKIEVMFVMFYFYPLFCIMVYSLRLDSDFKAIQKYCFIK